jgi:hypothetical protein
LKFLVRRAVAIRLAWGAGFGAVGLAGGGAFVILSGMQPQTSLSGSGLYILAGLFSALLLSLAVRAVRGALSAPPVSAFARGAALASGVLQLAFLGATLILLAAWLAALALSAGTAPQMLEALILVAALAFGAIILSLSIVNMAMAFQGTAGSGTQSRG